MSALGGDGIILEFFILMIVIMHDVHACELLVEMHKPSTRNEIES